MSEYFNKTSLVVWYDSTDKHKCGYCKNEYGSISDGMFAETMTVEDYQNLIDRGWRRSGKYCYKPIMNETCCPQYTIKCDALNFCISQSQKKVIKKFNKFLEDGLLNKTYIPQELQGGDQQDTTVIFTDHHEINLSKVIKSSENIEIDSFATGEPHEITSPNVTLNKQQICSESSSSSKTIYKPGIGADSNKPPCKKAKLIRLEKRKEKLLNRSITVNNDKKQIQKTLEHFIEEVSPNPKVKLKLHLVPTSKPSSEWENSKDTEFLLYKKYQMLVHNDPPEKLSMKSFYRFLVHSPLQIILVKMSADSEHFHTSAKLFEKYQMCIHNDPPNECDEDTFYGFLVKTPLKAENFPNEDGPGFGSFHQQYWLDDKLIAVGVIDILPKCISSVYFFYDPDYRNLTLGTYGSLREIYLTRYLCAKVPELKWYYMGFYIHSSPKMRYKGKLSPSLLLCPESYCWIPIEKCLEPLDKNKYSRLNEDIDAVDENFPTQLNISNMKIVYKNELMYLKDYRKCKRPSLFNNIAYLIGKKCTHSMVFWITEH